MRPQQQVGRAAHGLLVEGGGEGIAIAPLEDVGRGAVPDPVDVGLLPAAQAGVEALGRLLQREGTDIVR